LTSEEEKKQQDGNELENYGQQLQSEQSSSAAWLQEPPKETEQSQGRLHTGSGSSDIGHRNVTQQSGASGLGRKHGRSSVGSRRNF
jgi:hypothetical protein